MNLLVPIAMITLLQGCNASSQKTEVAQVARHGKPSPDYALRVVHGSFRTDRCLMKDGLARWGKLKVGTGDVVTVTLTLVNLKDPRTVVMKPRTIEFPAIDRPGLRYQAAVPAIPGGYEIIDVKGLERELASLERRAVTIRIKFNSDKPQMFELDFLTVGAPLEDMLSSDSVGIDANQPEDLAEHEFSMGRAKHPWAEPQK